LLYYSILAVVFAYVVGFTLVAKKGYQATVPAVGSIALKVKGIASRPSPPGSNAPPELWDASDLTVYDATSVFVATNIMRTEQARGVCPGTHEDEACALPSGRHEGEASTECREGAVSRSGAQTGRCVPASFSLGDEEMTRGACEVRGWCPGEPDADALAPLENVGNFTVFLRTDVRFPGMRDKFGRTFDVTNANGTEPTLGWNLFTLDEILTMGGVSYEDVKATGADLQMNIYYDCDLDNALEACVPRMPFEVMRIDTADSSLSHGYNARWLSAVKGDGPKASKGTKFDENADTRALVKASGPRIRVSITGVGRRFDLEQLTTVVGAGVALMGVATAVVDVLLLYVLPKRAKYFGLKYQTYGAGDEDLSCGGGEAARESREDAEEPLLAA
jgi:P2X purinoceptor 4